MLLGKIYCDSEGFKGLERFVSINCVELTSASVDNMPVVEQSSVFGVMGLAGVFDAVGLQALIRSINKNRMGYLRQRANVWLSAARALAKIWGG